MKKNKIWLSPIDVQESDLQSLISIVNKNGLERYFNQISEFETSLENYLKEGVKVAALSSGTSAIHMALIECGIQAHDEVICQSLTFSASANPIIYCGGTPIFVDSEPDTWNMCPTALEQAIEDRIKKGKTPKAIIAVHLYGMPAKLDEISQIAKKHDIPLIEDAAEALGSTYKGQKCGTFGDWSIISFNENKIITTSGGGVLICKTQDQKDKAVFLSTQAKDNAPHYQHSEIGYNYRMSNICAGIGRGQMEVLEERINARRRNHQFYKQLCSEIEGITLFTEPNADYFSNHWLSAIIIDENITGFTREDLRLKLLEDNIESRPLWKPMHLQPVFSEAPYYGGTVAEDLFAKGLCLPSGSSLNDEDRERIKNVILRIKK